MDRRRKRMISYRQIPSHFQADTFVADELRDINLRVWAGEKGYPARYLDLASH